MAEGATNKSNPDLSIVLCGQAGQGIQTVEHLLTKMLKCSGYNIFTTKEYMSRVRGGMNSTQIRISENPVNSPLNRMDILVPLDKGGIGHVSRRISPRTVVLGEKEVCGGELPPGNRLLEVPFTKIAMELGNKVFSNTVAVGALMSLLGIDLDSSIDYMRRFLPGKTEDVFNKNIAAAKKGFDILSSMQCDEFKIKFKSSEIVKGQILLNGSEAVGLGALAGGCNFVSSYPMSPSTGVLTFLAQNGSQFGIVVEQAEDEVAAMNMAIGAWYAGARGMATTSGGGFALMVEGLSLAGMLESPMVVHLAQRPGPATGLPTRTEQGDLEFALYAGHGDFPRIILAPGNLEEGFSLAHKAFNLADKYQVPVFIMTDQFFTDSCYNTGVFDLNGMKVEKCFIETGKEYKRYELTESGISPRGVPGFGQGLVCVDSDEHDQEGHITEDLELRVKMVDKRMEKLGLMIKESIPPELIGPENYKKLVVCWGSTLNAVREAVGILGRADTAVLHFLQVYPLNGDDIATLIGKAEKTVIVENNMTGQFERILKIHAGAKFDHRILKYNGLAFAADELAGKLESIL